MGCAGMENVSAMSSGEGHSAKFVSKSFFINQRVRKKKQLNELIDDDLMTC